METNISSRWWVNLLVPIASIAGLVLAWGLVVWVAQIPSYVLPSPAATLQAIITDWPAIIKGIAVTSQEFVLGFIIGSALGFILAILMSQSSLLYRFLYPVLIVTQAVPVVAIGAALVIWLGFGLAPKLFIVGLIVFFPVLVNVLDGLRSVDKDSVNLARAMGAGRWKTFRIVRLPATYTPLFSALKMSATFSVTGAVLAESIASTTGGLGVYLSIQQSRFNTAGVFAAIVVLAAIGLTAFLIIAYWELAATPWRRGSIAPRRRRFQPGPTQELSWTSAAPTAPAEHAKTH